MAFVRLGEAVTKIAECVELEPHNQQPTCFLGQISEGASEDFWETVNPKIEWARRFGVASWMLNKALHEHEIRWFEYDGEKRFAVQRDTVRDEGIALLTHATKWGDRELTLCCDHFRDAITQGDEALKKDVARGKDDGLAPDGKLIRWSLVGFDLSDLLHLLEVNSIAHSLPQQVDQPPAAAPWPAPAPPAADHCTDKLETPQARSLKTTIKAWREAVEEYEHLLIFKRKNGQLEKWMPLYLDRLEGKRGAFQRKERQQIRRYIDRLKSLNPNLPDLPLP